MKKGPRKQDWATPPGVVRELATRYAGGAFTLDAAATPENSVAPRHLGDAFEERWSGRVFCNPPYSRILPWVERAIEQVYIDNADCVIMLLPARTGSDWFRVAQASGLCTIAYIRGRIAFLGADGEPSAGNYEDSLVLVLRRTLEAKNMNK